ncbi:MAG: site-2 protease family protein [Microcoleus sp.]
MSIDFIYLACVLVAVLLSMTLHEAMHAYAGYWLGDETAKQEGRLTLNPLAHIDPFATVLLPLLLVLVGAPPFGAAKPVPFNPHRVRYGDFGAAMVGLAGPLTNFVLAFIGFALLVLIRDGGVITLFFQAFVAVNLGFFIFNMIPLPPLDGSRLLYAVAPRLVQQVMEAMERYGIVVVFAVVLLFNAQLGLFMQTAVTFFIHLFSLPFGNLLVV